MNNESNNESNKPFVVSIPVINTSEPVAKIIKTTGRPSIDIIREYINTSHLLDTPTSYAGQHSSIEDFKAFLEGADIRQLINVGGIFMTPIEYIIYRALKNRSYTKLFDRSIYPIEYEEIDNPGLEGIYRVIDLFIHKGATFKYDKRKFDDLLIPKVTKYTDNRKDVEEYENVLKQMNKHYSPASTAASAAASTGTGGRRNRRTRSIRRKRRAHPRKISRKSGLSGKK